VRLSLQTRCFSAKFFKTRMSTRVNEKRPTPGAKLLSLHADITSLLPEAEPEVDFAAFPAKHVSNKKRTSEAQSRSHGWMRLQLTLLVLRRQLKASVSANPTMKVHSLRTFSKRNAEGFGHRNDHRSRRSRDGLASPCL
jgi:hypothetical protein